MVLCPAIISPMTFSVRVDLGPHGGMVSIGCAGGLQMLSLQYYFVIIINYSISIYIITSIFYRKYDVGTTRIDYPPNHHFYRRYNGPFLF